MPRAKQSGKAKKRAKRNSKSATDDTTESESMEQTEMSDQLHESQQSEEINESKGQLNVTETSEQLDSSTVSDNATQDSEMTDDNQDYQSGRNTYKNEKSQDQGELASGEQKQTHITENSSKSDHTDEGNFTNNRNSTEKSKMSPEKLLHLESSENKLEKKVEEEPVTSFKPHTFPAVSCSSLVENYEWHIRVYPVDQADIRNCVLNSAAKLAEETWFHVEKKNNGMGVYDLCAKNVTDATSVMLKITQTPMTYRYVTVQVIRRSPNQALVEELKETLSEKEESDLQTEIDKLSKTEIKETAVLLLDFMHIQNFDSKEGKEKKRSLFVKYLPEGTTKELLNVLFPLANNLDIIKTGKGRSDGDLKVTETNNIIAYCKTYVAISIGDQNVYLDWKEESIEDGSEVFDATEDSPFEILPKNNKIVYGAVPEMEEDETVQYLKRKRDIEIEQRRLRMEARFDGGGGGGNRSKHDKGRMKGEMRGKSEGIRPLMEGLNVEKREKRSRWDKDVGPSLGAELLKRQMAMNEKIQSQLALLQSASIGAIPSLLDAPLLQGSRSRKDRKRDRFERDRKTSESNRSENSRQSRERNVTKKDKSGDRKNSTDDRPDPPPKGGRFENKPRGGGHFGGGNRFDEPRGRGGRLNEDRFGGRGGRFPGPNRGGHFDNFGRDAGPVDIPVRGGMPPRGGPFEPPGRLEPPGRGGHFGRAGRFDGKERGGHFEPPGRGGHFDSSGRGGHFEQGGRGGFFDSPRRGGHFDSPGRGGSMGRGGHFEPRGRGGQFDSAGRGGHFESTGRGGHFDNPARGVGRFDNQGRGRGYFDRQGRGGRMDGPGRGGGREDRGRGTGGFDNRNKGKSFDNRGNDQFTPPVTGNFDQQNYGTQNYGNPPSYNYNQQQTGYDNQSNYNSTQGGYNTQMSYNQQNPYNQGSYGTQQTTVAPNPPTDYSTQQTAQTGYTTQVSQPVSYPTQTNMYGTQQAGYDQNAWAQQTYAAPQQTGYTAATGTTTENYWGQPADYTAQATTAVGQQQDYSQAYAQQATPTNPTTGYAYNTQNLTGTEYTADAATAAAAYANQGYYSTGQATAGVTDATYGAYSTQDNSVYGQTPQSTLTTAYNFAQYPSTS